MRANYCVFLRQYNVLMYEYTKKKKKLKYNVILYALYFFNNLKIILIYSPKYV